MAGNATDLYRPTGLDRFADAVRRATPPLAAALLLLAVVVGACTEQRAADRSVTGTRLVGATVLDPAPPAFDGDTTVVPTRAPARAVWRAPDGSARVGTVLVHDRVGAGQSVPVWVDGRGSIVPRPPVGSGPVALGLLIAVGGIGVLVVARATTGAMSSRARSRAWAREWAMVEPALSGRLR